MANRIKGITVEIGGDTTKLSKALEGVNRDIKGTQTQLKDVQKLLKLAPTNTELLSQKHKLLADAVSATKEKLEVLKTAAEQANTALANGEISQQQYDALQREIIETENELKRLTTEANNSHTALEKMGVVGEKMQDAGDKISGVGQKLLPVTAGVTALGTIAVKTGADFDSAMSKVAAVSGATGSEMDALREKAREMGSKTKFSASEAADAMNYMAMAGWKTNDMLSGIEGIMSGKGHFFINGEEKTVSAGNIIVYLPDQPQEYVYYRADQTDVYWVHFTGHDVDSILKYYNVELPNNILYIGTSPDYQWLFGQMIQELQLCRPRYEELISLQLRNIFILISRAIMSAKKFSSTSEKEVAFAMHYFRKNYNTEISIEEYSESRGLSNCWFIQCFKEITGSSPLQYILKLRISNAQSLLENTDYTITEIANMVGYTNSLYFSRLFHKYIGMSPKEYRKLKLSENIRE